MVKYFLINLDSTLQERRWERDQKGNNGLPPAPNLRILITFFIFP